MTALAGVPAVAPAEIRPGQARTAAWIALLAVVASLIVAPPWRAVTVPLGAAQLVSGSLELVSATGSTSQIEVGATIARGSLVRSQRTPAILKVTDGEIEVAPRSALVVDDPIDLREGSILVESTAVLRAMYGLTSAQGRGTWRLDAGVAPRVAVYEGGVGIAGATGTAHAVAQLQQYDITDGPLAADAAPIRYLLADPWDARLLAEAIAVDQQAERLQRSLSAQYGRGLRGQIFYNDFVSVDEAVTAALPRIAPAKVDDTYGPPEDVLLSIIVIDLLASRARLEPDAAIDTVLDLRARGASWGVILVTFDFGADDLRLQADLALRRRVEQVQAAPRATPGSNQDPNGQPSPGPSDQPSPGPTDEPTEDPTDEPGVLDPATTSADEVLGDIAELIDPILPGTGTVIEGVGDLVDIIIP